MFSWPADAADSRRAGSMDKKAKTPKKPKTVKPKAARA
jgi:hypothetical protein